MKENDIRPNEFRKELDRLQANDIKRILKYKKKFLEVNCPACENEQKHFCFKKKGFNFVKCKKCDTLFVSPRPTMDILEEYYSTSEHIKFFNDKIYKLSEKIRKKKIFYPRVEKVLEFCEKYKIKNNSIFDIGAGFGTFCELMQKTKRFKNIIAIEPSKYLSETCKKKKINTIALPIEKVENIKADVITCFELLEHLFAPKKFLDSCYNILNKNGLMILTTVNIQGFDLLVLNKKSDNILAPNHLNYFNIESLVMLLKKCKFKILEIETPGKLDVDIVYNKIKNGIYKIKDNPFFDLLFLKKYDKLNLSFKKFLIDNHLSSHLWIIAKK